MAYTTCKRCGFPVSGEPERCPNCERVSWRKPLYLLTTREMRGLDSLGRDLRCRREGCAIRSVARERDAGREARKAKELKKLLGED